MSTMLPTVPTAPTNPLNDLDQNLDLELDLFLSLWTESEQFHYQFQTTVLGAPTDEFLPLRSWTHLAEVLAGVVSHGLDDHLIVQNARRPQLWAQLKPVGPGEHRVELSDGHGWVEQLCPAHAATTWSTDQAFEILRRYVIDGSVRQDSRRVPIPKGR